MLLLAASIGFNIGLFAGIVGWDWAMTRQDRDFLDHGWCPTCERETPHADQA